MDGTAIIQRSPTRSADSRLLRPHRPAPNVWIFWGGRLAIAVRATLSMEPYVHFIRRENGFNHAA
jgi:hypothetical protein